MHGTLSTQRFAVKTQLIKDVGAWPEDFKGWEDWNLGVRMLLHTDKIHWIKEPPLVTQYMHSDSITGQKTKVGYTQFHLSLRYTRKNIAASTHPQKLRLERLVIYRQILLAAQVLRAARQLNDEELHLYSRELYEEAMHDADTTSVMRLFFVFCYHYAAMGGRGAGTIAPYIIR